MSMAKRMISLPHPANEYAKAEAARLGITVSELIRRIVDQYRASAGVVATAERATRVRV